MLETAPTRLDAPLDALGRLAGLAELPPAFAERLVALRRHLHRYPEVGTREVKTSALIRRTLEEAGLVVHGAAGTGLYVDIEGDFPGPHVGYRADIDALPTTDAKETPYASQYPGVAHLCGHDAHTTVGVGVALLLSRVRQELHGTVRVFFQPNEEGTPGGAVDMIADGVVTDLEAVYAIHVDPTLPTGHYGLIVGAATAAVDLFEISVEAPSSGHSARPHETRDTIWIAHQILNALYQIVGRLTDARNASILTVCRFHGGDAFNVIPKRASFGGTLRTTSLEDRTQLLDRMKEIAERTGALYDARVGLDVELGAPPVLNDARLISRLEKTIRSLSGDRAVHHIARPSMGGEDFAHYVEHVPGALLRVGTSAGPATSYPLHDAHFDLDERALAPTVLLMARTLADHLRERA